MRWYPLRLARERRGRLGVDLDPDATRRLLGRQVGGHGTQGVVGPGAAAGERRAVAGEDAAMPVAGVRRESRGYVDHIAAARAFGRLPALAAALSAPPHLS
ncbi:hypothetical protein [Rhizomonospora bruguierae]|uniref:hypothetical protein n=1 Tax=Rhizomonospora bruguierae TaxID=1581705 RepID=UPI001BCC57AF|nr:hypothetical protein [Micromonospora sp. NBRC 107566]